MAESDRNREEGRGEFESSGALLELGALVLVLVVAGVVLAVRFHPFLIPNNDFHTFDSAARALFSGELPFESKRLPLFPGLMALASPLFGGAQPFLDAALVWNALFCLGSIAGVFALARRFRQGAAALAVALYVGSVQLFVTGLSPLVDASLGFGVIAAFVLFARRSRWQYAVAACVALSRYEAAALVPLLVVANAFFDGSARRHASLGLLALLPLGAWRLAASLSGVSGGSYVDLMAGMGFAPAPAYLGRVFAEAFPILYAPTPLLPMALALVGVPLLVGLIEGVRREPRLALTALLFFGVQTLAVVVFGIPKARYAQAVTWLPVILWSLGALGLADRIRRRLPETVAPRWMAALGVAGALVVGLGFLESREGLPPRLLEPAAAVVIVVAASLGIGALRRQPGGLAVLAVVALLVSTGFARQRTALLDLHNANYGSYLVGGWIRESLEPGGGIVVLNPGAVQHMSGLPMDRLATFGASRAETPAALAAFMRERQISHVAWTWRPSVGSRSAGYYHGRMNVELADHFRLGDDVSGYRHVATLPIPDGVAEEPVQIYRLVSSLP